MVNLKLIWRYAFSKSNRHRNIALIILVGISVGTFALLVVLSLMNNLQSLMIENIKDIETFHVQVDSNQSFENFSEITNSYRFKDYQVISQTLNGSETLRLRLLEDNIFSDINHFSSKVALLSGSYPKEDQVLLSNNLRYKMGITVGDEIELTLLVGGRSAPLVPVNYKVSVSGIYNSPLIEFDLNTILGNIDLVKQSDSSSYALYLKNSSPTKVTKLIGKLESAKGWVSLNRGFYSALMLEKALMYLFLLFMFLILAINMKNAFSRLLHAKQQEVAFLKSIGYTNNSLFKVFIAQGVLISLLGQVIALVSTLFVKERVSSIFNFFNRIQRIFTSQDNILLTYPFVLEINISEIILVNLLLFLIALLFTYSGVKGVLKSEVVEILDE